MKNHFLFTVWLLLLTIFLTALTSVSNAIRACGGLHVLDSRVAREHVIIQSPGYENVSPNGLRCQWSVVSVERMALRVQFLNFDLDNSTMWCRYDKLQVDVSGSCSFSDPAIFCGTVNPPPVTVGNVVCFRLLTGDNVGSHRGFRVEVKIFGSISRPNRFPIPSNRARQLQNPTIPSCDAFPVMVQGSTQILSPRAPSSQFYPPNSICRWLLYADVYHEANLKFDFMEMEYHKRCKYDSVRLMTGEETHPYYSVRFCGIKVPSPRTLLSPVLIVFSSDKNVQYRGFAINVQVKSLPIPLPPPAMITSTSFPAFEFSRTSMVDPQTAISYYSEESRYSSHSTFIDPSATIISSTTSLSMSYFSDFTGSSVSRHFQRNNQFSLPHPHQFSSSNLHESSSSPSPSSSSSSSSSSSLFFSSHSISASISLTSPSSLFLSSSLSSTSPPSVSSLSLLSSSSSSSSSLSSSLSSSPSSSPPPSSSSSYAAESTSYSFLPLQYDIKPSITHTLPINTRGSAFHESKTPELPNSSQIISTKSNQIFTSSFTVPAISPSSPGSLSSFSLTHKYPTFSTSFSSSRDSNKPFKGKSNIQWITHDVQHAPSASVNGIVDSSGALTDRNTLFLLPDPYKRGVHDNNSLILPSPTHFSMESISDPGNTVVPGNIPKSKAENKISSVREINHISSFTTSLTDSTYTFMTKGHVGVMSSTVSHTLISDVNSAVNDNSPIPFRTNKDFRDVHHTFNSQNKASVGFTSITETEESDDMAIPIVMSTGIGEGHGNFIPTVIGEGHSDVIPTSIIAGHSDAILTSIVADYNAAIPTSIFADHNDVLPTAIVPGGHGDSIPTDIVASHSDVTPTAVVANHSDIIPTVIVGSHSDVVPTLIDAGQRDIVPTAIAAGQSDTSPNAIVASHRNALPTVILTGHSDVIPTSIESGRSDIVPTAVVAGQSDGISTAIAADHSDTILNAVVADHSDVPPAAIVAGHSNFSSTAIVAGQSNDSSTAVVAGHSDVLPNTIAASHSDVIPTAIFASHSDVIPTAIVARHSNIIPTVIGEGHSDIIHTTIVDGHNDVIPTAIIESHSDVFPTTIVEGHGNVNPTTIVEGHSDVIPTAIVEGHSDVIPTTIREINELLNETAYTGIRITSTTIFSNNISSTPSLSGKKGDDSSTVFSTSEDTPHGNTLSQIPYVTSNVTRNMYATATISTTDGGIAGDSTETSVGFGNVTLTTMQPSASVPIKMDICETFGYYPMVAGNITVHSPGADAGRYPPNVNCDLILMALKEMDIKIHFLVFRLEYHLACSYDFLEISAQDTDSSANSPRRFCGVKKPDDIDLTDVTALRLRFVSDPIVTSVGFQLSLEVLEKAETPACKAGRLLCDDGSHCIPESWKCDAEEDCPDGSDEKECDFCTVGEFHCENHVCLPLSAVCDDNPDCDHGEDEQKCVGKQNTTHGVLEVRVAGSWLPVCADSINDLDLRDERLNWACAGIGMGPPAWASLVDVKDLQGNITQFVHLVSSAIPVSDKNVSSVCHTKAVLSLSCEEKACGRKETHLPQPYVLGSTFSVNGQWPWTVAIFTDDRFKCGATLISDRWILTASHCVYELTASPQNAIIKVGDVNFQSPDVQRFRISEVVLHPDNNYIYKNDIALLRLAQPVQFSSNQRPACLPTQQERSLNSVCYVAGWGVNVQSNVASEQISPILHHAKVKLWSQNRCQGSYPDQIRSTMMCAGYEHGEIDACKGDSGGPLMCRNDNDIWTVEGVVSWGEGCGTIGKPGVYTRVASYRPWIATVTDPSDTNVSCSFETSNMCGYSVQTDSHFTWTRRKAGFYYPTRPESDNTFRKYSSGHYAYAYVPYGARYLSTVLSPPALDTRPLNGSGVTCLRAYVAFTQCEGCRLVVRSRDSQGNKVNLMQYSSKGRDHSWTRFEVSVPTKTKAVNFVAITDKYTGGGIALDDIWLADNTCQDQSAITCSFDEGHLCRYAQDTNDDFDWRWNPGKEPATGGHITAESKRGLQGDTARIVSPPLPESASYKCLSFRLRLASKAKGSMQVCRQIELWRNRIFDCNIWTSQGLVDHSEESEWKSVQIAIPALKFRYSIVFQATKRSGEIGLDLDDIRLWSGDCEVL